MNSLLSAELSSPVHAACITFFSAAALLLAAVLLRRGERSRLRLVFSLSRPWWSGGLIGGTFVTGFAFFAAKVGVGVLLVTSICGMLACSLAMDKFGLLGAAKRSAGAMQYLGLICVMAGIAILRLN